MDDRSVAGSLLAGPACDGCAATWPDAGAVPPDWCAPLFKTRQGTVRSERKGPQCWPDVPDIGAGQCTRLDLACDLWVLSGWTPPEPAPPIGCGTVPVADFSLTPSFYRSEGGETYYAGSRNSEIMWRWYFYHEPEAHRGPVVLQTWAAAGNPDACGLVNGLDAAGAVRGWAPGAPGKVWRCEVQIRGEQAQRLYPIARADLAAAWAWAVLNRYEAQWPLPPLPQAQAPVFEPPPLYKPALDTLRRNARDYLRRQCVRYARSLGMAPGELQGHLLHELRRWLAAADPWAEVDPPPPKKRSPRKTWP